MVAFLAVEKMGPESQQEDGSYAALRNLLRTHYVSEMAHSAFEDLLCARNCPWCFWGPTMCQKLSIVPLRTYYVAETAHDTFEDLLCVRYSPWYF